MDHKFTEQLRKWLETPETERDYQQGALMLLRLSGNRIMYNNIIRQIDRRHDVVDYQLQKYYDFRVQELTHAQVEEMAAKVKVIAADNNLADVNATTPEDERRIGRREDHDKLPDEIRAKYVENLSILRRMRELHLRLRTLSLENATCPDSERYPFLKELIALDKKMHNNWNVYDHYVAEQAQEPSPDPDKKRRRK